MELDHVAEDIEAPIDRVWDLLADIGGVERLVPAGGIAGFPTIERVSMEGDAQGAIRTVHLAGGATIRERFDQVDASSRTIVYAGLPPMLPPIDNYRATIMLTSLGPVRTRVDWSSTGEPIGASVEDVRPVLETLHMALIEGARQLSQL